MSAIFHTLGSVSLSIISEVEEEMTTEATSLDQKHIVFGKPIVFRYSMAMRNQGYIVYTQHRKILLFVLQGTVSRDFRPSVFFIKQYPMGPWFTGLFEFCFESCLEFAEICSIFGRKNRACSVIDTACTKIFCSVAPLNLYIFVVVG
jgi:hypothetical protein